MGVAATNVKADTVSGDQANTVTTKQTGVVGNNAEQTPKGATETSTQVEPATKL